MPVRIALLVLVLCLGSAQWAAAAHAAAPDGGGQRARDAIELALDDPRVQARLALRPDEFDVRALPLDGDADSADRWIVGWYATDSTSGGTSMRAEVDLQQRTVVPTGRSLIVMPGEQKPMWLGPAWQWSILVLAFVACIAGAYGRGRGMRMLAPIAAIAAIHLAMVDAIVPQEHIRAGYLLLFGAADLALVIGAVIWMRAGTRSVARFEPRWSSAVWLVAWAVGLGYQLAGVIRVKQPIDVALASDIGARLMQGGVPVYGNIMNIPGLLRHGDTYGPISYLAYVPGIGLIGDNSVLWSNFAMSLVVSVLMLVTGLRGGSLRRGAWAAAAWSTCPFVALGVVAGNNDVVVALAVTLVLFLARRPAWRGSMVAVAACTKFLPAIIGVVVWRIRGEDRRDTLRYVLGGLVTLLVIFAVALRGTSALDEFWDKAIVFQLDRDDLASFWGMSELSQIRYVLVAAAVAVALYAARHMPRRDVDYAAAASASVLALVLAGLPQYWGTYVTWLVPAVLVAMLWPAERSTNS